MKFLPFIFLFFISFSSFSQQDIFQIEGRLMELNGKPVANAHIINFRNLDKSASRQNGVFNLWVLPTDSLIISHISYHRKIVTVHQLLVNPNVVLELDSVFIAEIDISPNQKTDYERARENIESIKSKEFPLFTKISEDPDPVLQLVTENNRLMRTEASSIAIVRFSPGELYGKWKKKRKQRKEAKQFSSTKKKE